MAGRNPAEALEAFVAPIRGAFSCITKAVPQHGAADPGSPGVLTIDDGGEGAVGLTFPGTETRLTFIHGYSIVEAEGEAGPWRVSTAGYMYGIDDEQGEVLSYQWHPESKDHPDPRPHLHLRGAAPGSLRLPAGRVAVEEIIRLLIDHFDVKPLREDWEGVLEQSHATFEDWQTWGRTLPPE